MSSPSPSIVELSPAEIAALMQREPSSELIDVRTVEEFAAVHAAGARNLPLDQIDEAALRDLAQRSRERRLLLICKVGGRSWRAGEAILAFGGERVVNVVGGTDAWVEAGLPAVFGP